MSRLLRDMRILPIVLVAFISLFALKVMGLLFEGGYTTSSERPPETVIVRNAAEPGSEPSSARRSWAQEMLGYPDDRQPAGGAPVDVAQNPLNAFDITGSVGATKEPPAPPKGGHPAAANGSPPSAGKNLATATPGVPSSPAERAILERLQERRGQIEARERDLAMREDLLKAAEKRLEERVGELKAIETRINETLQKKDEAEATRFKSLVSMYENMKAKEAARIFDRLDLKVLLDVTSQINPRRMSDILAQMTPEAAERLTVELAHRLNGKPAGPTSPAMLPKINGRPTN